MKIDFMGITVDTQSKEELTRRIFSRLMQGERSIIFTPNAVIANRARKDSAFCHTLMQADFRIPDGSGLVMAARIMGLPIEERLPGIELGEALLDELARRGGRAYFLGGRPHVAHKAAENMCRKHEGLMICGTHNGYFSPERDDAVCRDIQLSRPHLLAVCLGSPRQEQWVVEHKDALSHIPIIITLGGSLDVWSGQMKRAPLPLRQIGLEWLWRMLRQPRRFRDVAPIAALLFEACHTALLQRKERSSFKNHRFFSLLFGADVL